MEKSMKSRVASFLKLMVRSNSFALAVIAVVLGIITYFINGNFITSPNLRGGIFVPMVVPGVMIAAVGPLLIGGGIDLSCAAQAAFSSVIFANLLAGFPAVPWPVMLLVTLLCGAGFGLVNIFFANVLNLMPFITTIGMSSVYVGVASAWTKMNDVAINTPGFNDLGAVAYFNKTIPMLFILMLVLLAIYAFVLSYTRFGRSIYMVGGNQIAARLTGINPKKVRAVLFINSGVISAFSGVVWAAQQKRGHPKNIFEGTQYFNALTAVILSGTAFTGGAGGVAAGVIALLMVQVFDNSLTILAQTTAKGGQPLYGSYVNLILKGLILIIALMVDYLRSRSATQRALAAAIAESEKGAA